MTKIKGTKHKFQEFTDNSNGCFIELFSLQIMKIKIMFLFTNKTFRNKLRKYFVYSAIKKYIYIFKTRNLDALLK